jgi:S1-C subfamily serine protease
MKRAICLCVLLASGFRLPAQVTGNVISRVSQIKFNGFSGSAFLLDYGGKSYYVTAEHMVKTAGDHASIEVLGAKDSVWRPVQFDILHGQYPCVDVAVLVEKNPTLSPIDPIPYDDPLGYAMGQEAYFLGFPFGLFTGFDGKAGEKFAVPLIKHGYISANVPCSAIYEGGTKDDGLILLDGINNHGFSGGPVVAPNVFNATHTLKLIGVISGYKYETEPVNVDGKPTANVTGSANSGIIIVIPISQAINLIKDHLANNTAVKRK